MIILIKKDKNNDKMGTKFSLKEKLDVDYPSEAKVAYMLGNYLEENKNSKYYSKLGSLFGEEISIYFSPPDIDLLEINSSEICSYEVKGYRNEDLKNEYILKAVGQAVSNLICKVKTEEDVDFKGLVDKSYIALPDGEYPSKIFKSISDLPVGLVRVKFGEIEEVVPAKKNPYLDQNFKELFLEDFDLKDRKSYHRRYKDDAFLRD